MPIYPQTIPRSRINREIGQNMPSQVISITEVTVVSGKTARIQFDLDGSRVSIVVPIEVKAHFDEQFSRTNPTTLQKKKYATVMNLMRAAYKQGKKDGSK